MRIARIVRQQTVPPRVGTIIESRSRWKLGHLVAMTRRDWRVNDRLVVGWIFDTVIGVDR